MTINEVLDENKDKLKEFFKNEENQILLAENNFEKLYRKWDYSESILTALFLKSNTSFLNHMGQIPAYCFYDLDISNIIIPDNITSIDAWAFCGCNGLTRITIPDSVTSIGPYAFSNCSSLTSITIPSSVTDIGSNVFENCSSLTRVNYLGTIKEWTQISFNFSSYSNPLMYAKHLYINNEEVTQITANDLQGIIDIGDNVFSGCSSLTSITIPNSVTDIGWKVFYDCNSLTNITIPDSVTSIGENVFYDCSNLTKINYLGTKKQWEKIHKLNGWDYRSSIKTIQCTDGDINL